MHLLTRRKGCKVTLPLWVLHMLHCWNKHVKPIVQLNCRPKFLCGECLVAVGSKSDLMQMQMQGKV